MFVSIVLTVFQTTRMPVHENSMHEKLVPKLDLLTSTIGQLSSILRRRHDVNFSVCCRELAKQIQDEAKVKSTTTTAPFDTITLFVHLSMRHINDKCLET